MAHTSTRPNFEFADGLRAVAALSVAVLHATTFTGHSGDVARDMPYVALVMDIANYAVPAFIALSGYVLMLPVARRDGYELRGGFKQYIGRRARRILPPYYASLAIFLVLIALVPALQKPAGTAWDDKVPVSVGGVVSHLLMVHNWNPDWVYQINGPAWSVATEWQIYFVLPLIALPLCRLSRRGGPWIMAAVLMMIGPIVTYVFPQTTSASYWLIGVFGLGALAAVLTVGERPRFSRWYGWAGVAAFLVAAVWAMVDTADSRPVQMVTDTLAGSAVALGLASMGRASLEGRMNPGRRVFEGGLLVKVGLWSYSIYLIHSPLIGLANLLLLPLTLPTWLHWAVLECVALPIALGASYAFFLLVERRFMTNHQKQELRASPVS